MYRLTKCEQSIIEFLNDEKGSIKIPELAMKLNIQEKNIYRYCRKLREKGLIEIIGNPRNFSVKILKEIKIL